MDKAQFFAEIAEIIESDLIKFTGTENLDEIGNWDSLSVITFVAMVDDKLGQIVDTDKLRDAKTLDDLAALVSL